jgi:ElaB/YqjD/DUF883 family membrane-anchored ribosome-binding protein
MATEADAKSLSELEREAEHMRADLVDTVDKLHSRVSPQAIKEEVKAYVREASYDLVHNLERRARENPLQTVAVAAGLVPGMALPDQYSCAHSFGRSRPRAHPDGWLNEIDSLARA